MVPPYEGLYAKAALWKGAFLQKNGKAADADAYYEKVVDLLAEAINQHMLTVSNQEWSRNAMSSPRSRLWKSGKESDWKFNGVSVLQYDYENNQVNSLMKHFDIRYPNKYWLRPSEVGRNRFLDSSFNPGSDDSRYG